MGLSLRCTVLWILLVGLAGPALAQTLPPPGTWVQAPNSVLYPVMPPEAKVAGSAGTHPELYNPANVMAAWCGGDVAQLGGSWGFLIWGGGHGDSADNSLYFIPFDGSGPRSLMGPYLAPAGVRYFDQGIVSDSYAGRSRNQAPNVAPNQAVKARHTYSSILALRDRGLAWAYGGGVTSGPGGGTASTRTFDFSQTPAQAMARPDMGWELTAQAPDFSVVSSSGYDEKRRVVVTRGATFWGVYNPDTKSWKRLGSSTGGSDYTMSVAVDSEGRKMWLLGGRLGEVIDLDTYAVTQFLSQTVDWSQPGAPTVVRALPSYEWAKNFWANGLAWHPVRKRLLLWQGGQSIVSVDPSNHTVETLTLGGAVPTGPAANGTFGRFRLIPGTDTVAVVNGVTEPVFLGTLPAATDPSRPRR